MNSQIYSVLLLIPIVMKKTSHQKWYNTLQKNIHIAYIIHHLSKFKTTEQVLIFLLCSIIILFIFSSLIVFEPLSGWNPQYLWLLSGHFNLTAIIIIIILSKLLIYNTSFWFKDMVDTIIGNKEQWHLYNILWLLFILVSLLSIQDMVWLTQLSWSSYSIASNFYTIQFIIICTIIYSIWLTYRQISSPEKHLQPTIHYQSDDTYSNKPSQTLFE